MPFIYAWTIPRLSNRRRSRPGVVLDYNAANEVVGVEMLSLSKRSSDADLSAFLFETV